MKLFIAAVMLAVAAAAPNDGYGESRSFDEPESIGILRQSIEMDENDQSYQHTFETENGISAAEVGQRGIESAIVVDGSFSYTADDGQVFSVAYVANENGFQPQGDHLPTAVPTQYPTPEVPLVRSEERDDVRGYN